MAEGGWWWEPGRGGGEWAGAWPSALFLFLNPGGGGRGLVGSLTFISLSSLPHHILPVGSQTLPGSPGWGGGRYPDQEGFAHYPAAGSLTFEGEGSDHLGLNCKTATRRAAGEQLPGCVQCLHTPSALGVTQSPALGCVPTRHRSIVSLRSSVRVTFSPVPWGAPPVIRKGFLILGRNLSSSYTQA